MKKAPILKDEEERLEQLRKYMVLDTGPEKSFDEITKLASMICDCNISLVSLVDDNRQWFKSSFGLGAKQTPRDISYCGHAIETDDIFIIEDSELDERFCDNPLFTGEPHVRFYAGMPLVAPNGKKIGTLCVIDNKAKKLNDLQIKTLKTLANNVINLLELRLKNMQLYEVSSNYRDKAALLDFALDGTNLGVWNWNLSDNSVTFDERWAQMLGLNIDEVQMHLDTWKTRVHPDDIDNCYIDIQSYLDGKTDRYENIHRMKHADGSWVYILDRGKISKYDADGNPLIFTGTHQDITQSEAYKKKLSLFFEKSTFGYAFCKMDGTLLEVNKAYEQITGYNFDELKKLTYWDLTPKEYEDEEQLQLDSLETKGRYGPYKKEYIRKDGTRIPVELNGFVVEDYDGVDGIWSIVEDITEKNELEAKLHYSRKMAAIGELAAGVGHEINNPLTIIDGYLTIIDSKVKDDSVKKLTEKIKVASNRIAKIVANLRTFSRNKNNNETFCVDIAIDESVEMFKDIYARDGIDLNLIYEDKDLYINSDRGEFQQVFVNLISNAKDVAANSELKKIDVSLKKENEHVLVQVKDYGDGIDDELKDKIFEPFFTTKGPTEGTGIGLSLALSIIQDYGGDLYFKNNSSTQGTSFFIKFPLALKEAKQDHKVELQSTNKIKKKMSILVVDDEEDIRQLLKSMLDEMKMDTFTASNGKEALELIESSACEFDMIISDMKMPEMRGDIMFREFRKKYNNSKTKLIAITGGININFEDEKNDIAKIIDGFLYKPFNFGNIEDLLRMIE
ncbi:MAG: PAS domain S-box protein [Bacteriovoracaceae bacterium]|jgi:PAS domain S-box-containing protein|nr:PAS domain S-box protein [Bacteriovoracaceae bacterium]